MVARGTPLPDKLKVDAVTEAILELRFDMAAIPEVLFGRLAEREIWRGYIQRPMPAYNIPAPMREADPNIRFQPILELVSTDGKIAIRVGNHALSYHRSQEYIGWQMLRPELFDVIDALFDRAADRLSIQRLGLRYVNVLNADKHGISSIEDLDLQLTIANAPVTSNLNLNFTTDLAETGSVTVRIATPDFVQGALAPGSSMVVDVDVATRAGFETSSRDVVKEWVDAAHRSEKQEFFHLLTQESINQLKEA